MPRCLLFCCSIVPCHCQCKLPPQSLPQSVNNAAAKDLHSIADCPLICGLSVAHRLHLLPHCISSNVINLLALANSCTINASDPGNRSDRPTAIYCRHHVAACSRISYPFHPCCKRHFCLVYVSPCISSGTSAWQVSHLL